MTRRATFTQAEINAVARAAKTGVRLALMSRPDGTKIIVPAEEMEVSFGPNDFNSRLDAFASS